MTLQAPFPFFGGKSRVGHLVWERFGNPANYVEAFAGSLAVLLARPGGPGPIETVNDKDGFISNFWRAVATDPEAVAAHADWPVNEIDQNARHIWLVRQRETLTARLEGDPEYYDPKIAGWWVWGICCWIGAGWCSGDGPWSTDGAQLINIGSGGQGVHRKLVRLGNAGQGVHRRVESLDAWFLALSERLRRVRVCCGDWRRVLGETPTTKHGLTGVFLDPPYADSAGRTSDLYSVDDAAISGAVREWAIEHGDNPLLRIALCGYEGEHAMPDDWEMVAWKATGGYGSRNSRGLLNAHRERIWFNKSCLRPDRSRQLELLAEVSA